MIYLKGKNSGQVREYKDGDTSTVDDLLGTGNWVRVQGRKDTTIYSAPKKSKKKTK
jgi:hypothetical protein